MLLMLSLFSLGCSAVSAMMLVASFRGDNQIKGRLSRLERLLLTSGSGKISDRVARLESTVVDLEMDSDTGQPIFPGPRKQLP